MELLKICNIQPKYTTPYRPNSNVSERMNGILTTAMKFFIDGSQKNWCDQIPASLLAYNSKYQVSLTTSSFTLMHGFLPTVPKTEQITPVEHIELKDYQERWQQIRNVAEHNLIRSLYKGKFYQDRNRRPPTHYDDDSLVLIHFKRLTTRDPTGSLLSAKWKSSYAGPYQVLRKLNSLNYEVKLVHPIPGRAPRQFKTHVTRMKPYFPPRA